VCDQDSANRRDQNARGGDPDSTGGPACRPLVHSLTLITETTWRTCGRKPHRNDFLGTPVLLDVRFENAVQSIVRSAANLVD
jgi:hypothetical protein